jgi:hypothetical protein
MPHLQRNIAPPGASRPIGPSTWLALAGLWAFTHPWSGVHHDGILYAAQAMLHHLPEVFRGDLFFAYGSQDDYTVFGRAYGVAVDAFGLTGASRLGWAAAQLLWFGVAVAWISRVVPAGVLVPAAAVVFALPAFYSSDLVLRVAEPFLTARSFAEPLAAGGLLACLAGARAAGAALLLAAAVIHPIMAAPAVLAAALITFEPFWRRHWKPLLALGIAALAAVCWPFQGSWIARVDEPWYGLLRRCSPIVTPDEWRPLDWVRMLAPLVVLHQCARLAEGRWALAWRVIAACGALGLALTVLAALSRWELGLQVQFWRFGWIAAWLAPVAAIGTAAALPGERIVARVALLAAVPAIVLTSHPWLDLLWMIPALYLVCLVLLLSDEAGRSPRARGLAFAVFSLMFVAVVAAAVLVQMALTSGGDPDLARAGLRFALAREHLGWAVLSALVLAAPIVARRIGAAVRPLAFEWIGAIGLVLLAALAFDGRGPAPRSVDRMLAMGQPDWSKVIGKSQTVLWPEHAQHVWLVLNRRVYASRTQLPGAVFSRESAMQVSHRMAGLAAVAGNDASPDFRHFVPRDSLPLPRRADLDAACAQPGLDFVVLPVELGPLAAPPFRDVEAGKDHFLHRCADLRPAVKPTPDPDGKASS